MIEKNSLKKSLVKKKFNYKKLIKKFLVKLNLISNYDSATGLTIDMRSVMR